MRKALLSFLLLPVIFLSCTRETDTRNIPDPAALAGTWRMVTVKNNVNGQQTFKPITEPGDVHISFAVAGSAGGSFTGKTPSNDIWPNSYATGTGGTMSIPVLAMTKVGEGTWGNEFVKHIREAQTYHFGSDGKLHIQTIARTLIFVKQ
jgi:hypothetical protein